MNDMEKYFGKYRGLAEEMESCPSVTEQAFLGRLHEERARKRRFRRRTLALTLIGMAAALMVVIILPGREARIDPAEVYVANYREGVAPLLSEVRKMETDSELCREMGLSSVIESLLYCPEDLAEGLEDAEKLEVTKKYCNRSLDEIRTLYGECCRAYFIGTAAVHDN